MDRAGSPSVADADRPPPPSAVVPNWRGALQPLGVAAIAAAGCAYIGLMNPNESGAYPQCPLRAVTGLDCPGCGLTRSVYAFMHGDVLTGIDHNLLAVVLIPLAALAFVRWTGRRMGWATSTPVRWRPWMSVVAGIAVLGFLVARNLPGLEYLGSAAG